MLSDHHGFEYELRHAITLVVGWHLLCLDMRETFPLARTKRDYLSKVQGSGFAWLKGAIDYHLRCRAGRSTSPYHVATHARGRKLRRPQPVKG